MCVCISHYISCRTAGPRGRRGDDLHLYSTAVSANCVCLRLGKLIMGSMMKMDFVYSHSVSILKCLLAEWISMVEFLKPTVAWLQAADPVISLCDAMFYKL